MGLRVVHLDIMQQEVQEDLPLLLQFLDLQKVVEEMVEIVVLLLTELQTLVVEVAAMVRLELLELEVAE
tara:strand:- start:35 stop:241 length:207 start_codon:yes stop_codon:yes gene_type:complete